jgi:dCMP deaminase
MPKKKVNKRISREELFMGIATLASQRATCIRLKVGCVLVDDKNRIAAIGYNSSASKTQHCDDVGCLMHDNHCIRCAHGEVAAVSNLQRKYDSLTCYITHPPCINCYKLLITFNVKKIFYLNKYIKDEARDKLMMEVQVPMIQI